jgi:MFS transporter, DHA1 family, multidrug resistance protein
MFMFAAFLFGIGMPETYARQVVRTRARRTGRPHNLPKAESGVTIVEMAKVTIIDPVIMLVSEPIVIMSSLLLAANFGFLFQWFITVPVALETAYGFTVQRVGLAFTSALIGTALALATSATLDQLNFRRDSRKMSSNMMPTIEQRLYPAMIGAPLMMAALFWVANTAKPTTNYIAPITGTAVYVWGSMCVLIGVISYLFDAYPPKGTLSALTAAACLRIAMAGIVPLIVIQGFMKTGPKWTLGAFGFVVLALIPIPFIIFFLGKRMRERSRYSVTMVEALGASSTARDEMRRTEPAAINT